MKCIECTHKMKWMRLTLFQNKTHYCTHCGYNFRKTIFNKIILNPIYAIGYLSTQKAVTIFLTKESFKNYRDSTEKFVFVPLINSINLMK